MSYFLLITTNLYYEHSRHSPYEYISSLLFMRAPNYKVLIILYGILPCYLQYNSNTLKTTNDDESRYSQQFFHFFVSHFPIPISNAIPYVNCQYMVERKQNIVSNNNVSSKNSYRFKKQNRRLHLKIYKSERNLNSSM